MGKILVVIAVLLVMVGGAFAQESFFEEDACPFPDLPGVSCGYLIVPEDRTDPDSPEIELAVAIIEAESANPLPDPVVYLEGGPGGSALFAVEDYLNHPLRQNRDLILFDQRGTGFSFPSLNCYEMEEYDLFEDGTDAATACYERLLDEGVDLDQYDSAASAADINDLRLTLGYDEVNLWGISYGTRLALTAMRDYPDGIRAVVIDSVYPPEIDSLADGTAASIEAFDIFFAACAADAACNAEYPTLEADFYALVDEFNLNPPVFEYDDGFEVYELELYGDDLLEALFQTLYESSVIPMLPYGITLLANAEDDFDLQDGYDILLGFWTPEAWERGETDYMESVFDSDMVLDYMDEFGDISDSEGMFSAVECAEEIRFNDVDAAFVAADAAPEAIREWLYQSAESPLFECDIWAVEQQSTVETERVVSDIPTLLISGGYDPVTPPSYADSALETLSNGQHIVFPVGGHGETAVAGCAADLAKAFFDDPDAPLDTGCIPQQTEWYVE